MNEDDYIAATKGEPMELAQCDGCGFITNRPNSYRALLYKAVKIACCPEMKFKRFEVLVTSGPREVV